MKFKITHSVNFDDSIYKLYKNGITSNDVEINGIEPLDHQVDHQVDHQNEWSKAIELFDKWEAPQEEAWFLNYREGDYFIDNIVNEGFSTEEFKKVSDLIQWLENELTPKRRELTEFKKNQLVSVYDENDVLKSVSMIKSSNRQMVHCVGGLAFGIVSNTFYEYNPELDKV